MPGRRNERHTESIAEDLLEVRGFSRKDFQYQGSYERQISALLSSKKSNRTGAGKPEIICRLNGEANDLLVVECKNDPAFHASSSVAATQDIENAKLEPREFAADGVLHYMKGLRKEFNVVGLAISGASAAGMRITQYICTRGGKIGSLETQGILKPKQYLDALEQRAHPATTVQDVERFAEDLHDYLRDEMELSEAEKPLLVSAILLGLRAGSFRKGYASETTGLDLAKNLLATVQRKLESEKLHPNKVSLMMHNFGFIQNNTELHRCLKDTIGRIEKSVLGQIPSSDNFDLLGNFYGEFLKYSGGDKKGLGIVLTPRHITGLFAKLVGLEKDSVLLDPCAGTGGFLIAGMAEMIKKAKQDDSTIEEIKRSQMIGIEQNDRMFTMACANMLLRGDGKSNMFRGSCFDSSILARINDRAILREKESLESELESEREALGLSKSASEKKKRLDCIDRLETKVQELSATLDSPEIKKERLKRPPVAAILNPPYAKKAGDKHELAFVSQACDVLEPNGTCVAIVPMSCAVEATNVNRDWKRRLLEKHTLVAGFSMPEQLFPQIGVVTCGLVFSAHRPHPQDYETWFGYWRDDGFKLKKKKRVEIRPWPETESKWLRTFRRREVIPKYSVLRHVGENNEWCVEAYLEPVFSELKESDLVSSMREYVLNAFRIQRVEVFSGDEEESS